MAQRGEKGQKLTSVLCAAGQPSPEVAKSQLSAVCARGSLCPPLLHFSDLPEFGLEGKHHAVRAFRLPFRAVKFDLALPVTSPDF